MRHEHLHHLAQAASDNDSMAEEIGLEGAVARVGLNVEDVRQVAEQRALRAVMVESGRLPELQRAHRQASNRPQGFALSRMERHKLAIYTAMYMDAITLGWRANDLAQENS